MIAKFNNLPRILVQSKSYFLRLKQIFDFHFSLTVIVILLRMPNNSMVWESSQMEAGSFLIFELSNFFLMLSDEPRPRNEKQSFIFINLSLRLNIGKAFYTSLEVSFFSPDMLHTISTKEHDFNILQQNELIFSGSWTAICRRVSKFLGFSKEVLILQSYSVDYMTSFMIAHFFRSCLEVLLKFSYDSQWFLYNLLIFLYLAVIHLF